MVIGEVKQKVISWKGIQLEKTNATVLQKDSKETGLTKEYSLEVMGDRLLESKSGKQQYGWTLRTLCSVKRASHKKIVMIPLV